MDPLVRTALASQGTLSRTRGLWASGAFALLLTVDHARGLPEQVRIAAGASAAALLVWRLRLRWGRLEADAVPWRDLGLFSLAIVCAFAAVLELPARFQGSAYPLVYLVLVLVAAFASARVAVITSLFTAAVEVAIRAYALGRPLEESAPHIALICVFATVNTLVLRVEIARVRRLSRQRIDGELERLRDAARAYRLLGAPTSAVSKGEGQKPPSGDPERLLRSSVEQVHSTLKSALEMLRGALDLGTVALLWLDEDRKTLRLRAAASVVEDLDAGPFTAGGGILGAALASSEAVYIVGERARRQVPYYRSERPVGFSCALPLFEGGRPVALLVVDGPRAEELSRREQEALETMGRFVGRAIENERVFVQLEQAKVEQGKLYRAVELFAGAVTEASVIEAAIQSAREFTAFDFAAVTLAHRTTREHEICAVSGAGTDELLGRRFAHNTGLVAMAIANRHPLPYRGNYDRRRQTLFDDGLVPPDLASLLVVPLVVHDNPLGTLILGSEAPGAFDDEVRQTLEVLGRHFAVSLSNARMIQRLEDLATTDGMTGLYNKRALTEAARQKIRSAERFGKPLSLLVCDIDFFKRVNDEYGHDVGDQVIKGFGDVLKRVKRGTDQVGRFGGEEFVFVCEETDLAGAHLLGERVRTELEATQFHTHLGPLSVTCSVGVAQLTPSDRTWEALFKASDEALYVSKRNGRNRVTSWTPAIRGAAA